MTAFDMYWLTRLDKLIGLIDGLTMFMAFLFIASFMLCIVSFIIMKTNEHFNHDDHVDDDYMISKTIFSSTKLPTICTFVSIIALSNVSALIPTTKEMIAIKVIPAIATEENCKKLPEISKDFIDVTAAWLKDMKENKNK